MKLKKLIATLSIVTLLASQVNHLALAGIVSGNDAPEDHTSPHVYTEEDRKFMDDLKQYEGDNAELEINNYLSKTEEEKAQIRNEYYDQKAEYEGLKNNATAIKDKFNNAGSSTSPSINSNLKPNNSIYKGYDPNYTGVRQNAIQRSMVYADGIDADKIRKMATDEYTATKTKSLPTKINPQCNGYTTSSCGLTCCGKTECENICKDQLMTAYGKSTCLDGVYNSSYCGISCCGKADCERACINYRVTIDGKPADHGQCFPSSVTERDTGKTVSCCGYQDCREKECSGQLTVVNQDTGDTLNCCGAKECNQMKCNGYTSAQNVDTGVTYQCCGEYQCKQLECNGKLTVDSKINEGVKLSCCGTEDCESVACEGYTVANTPNGEVACCGYADCQNKKCEGQTAIEINGTVYACCGKENCNQVYEDNKFKAIQEETELYVAKRLTLGYTCHTEYYTCPSGGHCEKEVCGVSNKIEPSPFTVYDKTITKVDYTGPTYSESFNTYSFYFSITTLKYPETGKIVKKGCNYQYFSYIYYKGEHGCNSCTGPCRGEELKPVCVEEAEVDSSLLPKTAKESVWYGKTVVTNYTNCMREHGTFYPYIAQSGVKKKNNRYIVHFNIEENLLSEGFTPCSKCQAIPVTEQTKYYYPILNNNTTPCGGMPGNNILVPSDVGLCTVM